MMSMHDDMKELMKELSDEYDVNAGCTNVAAEALVAAGAQLNVVEAASRGCAGLTLLCYWLSAKAGWWDAVNARSPETFAVKIALIHSEVSEALEGARKECSDAHLPYRCAEEVELADAVIRIFDLAGARKLNIAGALIEKLAYNQHRADHKREARAAAGGKKF